MFKSSNMIYIRFNEQHGSIYYCSEFPILILKEVLRRRINDTFDGVTSVWYDDLTDKAREILDSDDDHQIFTFMNSRKNHEYEGFDIILMEHISEYD